MLVMRLADLDPERTTAELTTWAMAFADGLEPTGGGPAGGGPAVLLPHHPHRPS
jgi:hypothetical protein